MSETAVDAAQIPQLRAVHHLTEVVARATDPAPILDEALDVLIATLDADRASVLVFDDAGVMRFTAWRGLSDLYRQAADGHSPWTPDTPDPRPVLVPDVRTEPSLAPLRDAILGEGIHALAFVPLVSRARLLGKFMIYFDEPHEFTPDEVDLAQAVAAQVAFGIDQRQLEAELRLANATLATTLVAVPDGITVQSPDGRLLFANADAAAMLGFATPEELVAADPRAIMERFEIWDEHGGPLPLADLPGRRALHGDENPPELLVRYRTASSDEDRWSLVTARPVRAENGSVRFAVNVFRDITERQQALQALRDNEQRERFLATASDRLLDATLEYAGLLERVADLFVPAFADLCAVRELGAGGSVHRVALRHSPAVDGAEVERISATPDTFAGSRLLADLRAGKSSLIPQLSPEQCAAAAPLALQSALVVPIMARGACLGIISLTTLAGGRRYGPADLALAEEVARRAGLALDNARLFAERTTVASTLQRALLPPVLPDIAGLELAARYQPAASDIGGDFYDVIQIGPSRWVIAVGDVCGKGIEAASLTAMVRYTLRAFAAAWSTSPSALLSQVNEALSRQLGVERFCTIACAMLDLDPDSAAAGAPAGGTTITLALAGHPRPLVVAPDGTVRAVGIPAACSVRSISPTSPTKRSTSPRVRPWSSTPTAAWANCPPAATRTGWPTPSPPPPAVTPPASPPPSRPPPPRA